MKNRKLFIPLLAFTTVCLAALTLLSAAGSLRRASAKQQAVQQAAVQRGVEDGPGAAAEYDRLRRLPEGAAEVPVERLLDARERMKVMPRHTSAQGLAASPPAGQEGAAELQGAWQPLGPGNVGGRTRALIIHPANPSVMYAAGAGGGVWKTTNGGAAWSPLTDLLPSLAVCALAFDPQNPEVVYAGTGEGYFNGGARRGAGIFRTTNGGAAWSQLAGTNTADFHYVNDIAVSAKNGQRLYAATSTGVWRSVDGGASWARVLEPKINGGCLDLAARTDTATDHLFASCGTFTGAVVYRSKDAGGDAAWEQVLSNYAMGRTSLAVAPSNQNVVYALASAAPAPNNPNSHGLSAVFRSASGGDAGTWTARATAGDATKLNTVLLSNTLAAFGAECRLGAGSLVGQGWYSNVIAVDPVNENRVWAGGADLFRSDDGGANWGLASYSWAGKSHPAYVHADQHVIAFHPHYDGRSNRTMFAANDGGVFKTSDATADVATGATAACSPGNTKIAWQSLTRGYGVTQFFQGVPFPDGARYVGGTLGNGTLVGSDADGAEGWREVMGGSGGYVAVDPTNPAVIYAMQPGLAVRKSTDGGATFANTSFGLRDQALYVTPLVMDPNNPQRLWTGGTKLYRTENGAARWQEMISPVGGLISTIAVAPTDSNLVLFGSSVGGIHRLEEGVARGFNSALPRQGFVSKVVFDPLNRNIAYATYSTYGGTHVWKTTDGGASWFGIDGTGTLALPDVPVHTLVVDPADTRRLYIGTDLGVFATADGGATWAVENAGFANVPVESLALNTAGGETTLYAFTHGRGAWRVRLGAGCRVALSPPGQTFGVEGGAGSIQVLNEPQGCATPAAEVNPSGAGWLTVAGLSRGGVSFSVAPNNSPRTRVGTVAVAGRSFIVTQAGQADAAPVVTITSHPTGVPLRIYGSYYDTITLKGTAGDDDQITRLTWLNERKEDEYISLPPREYDIPVPAGGANQWTAERIYLKHGVNNLKITARDRAGNKSEARLTVIKYPEFAVGTLVGVINKPGYSGDGGLGTSAQLRAAVDVAVDKAGNIYIADATNHNIRRWDFRTGLISTVAGLASDAGGAGGYSGDGGPAVGASLKWPSGVAVDAAGNLYIADRDNHRVRKVTPDGKITTAAGTGGQIGPREGPAAESVVGFPQDVAVDEAGNLYIADSHNFRVCRVDAASGRLTTLIGDGNRGSSGDGGPAAQARLSNPVSLALDRAGNLYVADAGSRSVRKVTKSTGIITNIIGGNFSGTGLEFLLGGVAADDAGNIFISYRDWSDGRVMKIDASGTATIVAGVALVDPDYPDEGDRADRAYIRNTYGVAVEPSGSVVYSDGTSRVRRLFRFHDAAPPTVTVTTPAETPLTTSAGLLNFAGKAADNMEVTHVTWSNDRGGGGLATGVVNLKTRELGWKADNVQLFAGVNHITVTAWDGLGNAGSRTVRVVCNPAATFVTVAGDPARANTDPSNVLNGDFGGDGGQASRARLNYPAGVALDRDGNLYVSDFYNNRVRKVTRAGVITTVAGGGLVGSSGDGGPATLAALNGPTGIAVDAGGNIYFSDINNRRIRRVDAAGIITTVAGTGAEGFGGDGGPATAAVLARPYGLALDGAGNLLFADSWNHRIRKIALTTGVITTVAGNGYGFAGDGGPAVEALLNYPAGVAVDAAGNLFINDASNRRLRKVSAATGVITTVAGGGTVGDGSDGGPATGKIITPSGTPVLDAAGNLYFVDGVRVRKLTPDGVLSTVAGGYGVYPQTSVGDNAGALSALFNYNASLAIDGAGNLYVADSGNHRVVAVSAYSAATTGSAATYDASAVAAGSIVSVFGTNFAKEVKAATSLPLPTTLAGTVVKVRDSAGVERLAPLFFVSPFQINYQIPPGTAAGMATVIITNADGAVSTGPAPVVAVAPGLFSADSTGQGVAAALALRVRADGSRRYEPVAVYDAAQNRIVPVPLDFGPETDQLYLELYGTGIRGRAPDSSASVRVGGVEVPLLYAGAQGGWVGLDQVNVQLPRSLAGRGDVSVVLTVDGKVANAVTVRIK